MAVKTSKEDAVEIAVKFTKEWELADFLVEGVQEVERDGKRYWQVFLRFIDDSDLGLPDAVAVYVYPLMNRHQMLLCNLR